MPRMQGLDFPVVVVGAGPAGSWAAELLARGGLRALLIEAGNPPREKLCGGLLNRPTQELLGADLPDAVSREPHQPALEYHDLDNRLRRRVEPGFRNVSRGALDDWLRNRAADSGARLTPGSSARAIEAADGALRVDLGGEEVQARWVVDATGWRALARRSRGAEPVRCLNCLQGLIRLDPPPDAMWAIYHSPLTPFFSWIIPKGEGRFILGTGLAPGRRPPSAGRGHPGRVAAAGAWAPLGPILDYLEWRGHRATLLDHKPRGAPLTWIRGTRDLSWGGRGILPVGEAAGLVSPFSGEGLSGALLSAKAAAHLILSDAAQGGLRGALPTVLPRFRASSLRGRIAARPWSRRLVLDLMPRYLRRPVSRLPWRDPR